MPKVDSDTLYGTLSLLILRTLEEGGLHGLGVARRIGRVSQDVLRIEEGALYPALHRLERDGFVRAEWGISERNRRAKFYALTSRGKPNLTPKPGNGFATPGPCRGVGRERPTRGLGGWI